MSTWIDPSFDEAIRSAGLIAAGRVVAADHRGGQIEIVRDFGGTAHVGARVIVHRAAVVGRGHEKNSLPVGETLAFVVRGVGPGAFQAFTDSYWAFTVSEGTRVHMPVRDPFTRAYVPFDALAELARCMRDRSHSPAHYLGRQCTRLAETPVAATQPIEVNDQILALESLAHLGGPGAAEHAARMIGSPHFQVRWSAVRAVSTCGGPKARRTLLDVLAREDAPPVQAAIAEALARTADPSMASEIRAAIPRMFADSMPYSRNIMSPIMNMMPSPRATLEAVLARLGTA